jgi:hypothetical protein
MKRNIALAVVIAVLLTFAGIASAETIPRTSDLFPTGTVLNGTALVDSHIQNLPRGQDIQGNFGLYLSAVSPTGDADVQVEILYRNEADETWTTTYYYYDAENDVLHTYSGLVIDSTFTRFAREGAFYFFPIIVPLCDQFLIRVTGVGSNPADTVLIGKITRL